LPSQALLLNDTNLIRDAKKSLIKTIKKILLIYNKIQQNKLNEEKLIDNFYENHPQEIKKLLDS
jgi:hypothetical protein